MILLSPKQSLLPSSFLPNPFFFFFLPLLPALEDPTEVPGTVGTLGQMFPRGHRCSVPAATARRPHTSDCRSGAGDR